VIGMEFEQKVLHLHHNFKPEPELSVKVTRGQKGAYGWEISYSGKNTDEVIERIKEVDEKLREFLGGEGE